MACATAAGASKVSITQPDLQTDLTASNLLGEPVRLIDAVAGVESLAECVDACL